MRYVVFEFVGVSPSAKDAKRLIETTLKEQLGKIALAKHNIRVLLEKYDEKSATGLIKTEDPELVRAALLFCGSAINIKGVSGTIAGTEKFR